MKTKRLALILIVFCLAIGSIMLFTAWGKKKDTKKEVTLRFSWWGGDARHNATLAAIDLYMKLNPNVKILPEYGGAATYLEKKKIELASGTAPDVMQIDSTWIQELVSKGEFFADLSKIRTIDTKPFNKGFLDDFCMANGKLVGLPTGGNAQILLINKTAADKMGVNLKNLESWDTFLEEGKKLHAKDSNYYLLFDDTESFAGEVLFHMIKQRTGKKMYNDDYTMNFGKEDLVAAFTWLSEAEKGGVLQPAGEAALYTHKIEQNPKWINQQIICHVDWASSYGSTLLKDAQYVLQLPPLMKNAKSGCSQMRPSQELCINSKSPNIDEAAKFLNWFLNSKEAAEVLGDVRGVPSSSTASAAAAAAGKISKLTSDALVKAAQHRVTLETKVGNDRQIVQIALDIAQEVQFGKLTPEQAADKYMELATAKLKELKQ